MAILQIEHRCPHCRELKDFAISQVSEIVRRQVQENRAHPLWERDVNGRIAGHPPTHARTADEVCGLSRCPNCHLPVMFVAQVASSAMAFAMSARSNEQNRFIADFRVIATYPEVKPHQAHPTWPVEIAQIFNETRQFLGEGKSPFFVLAGCRSTLDVVTRKMGAETGNLKQRIDKLADEGKITAVLQNWAHKLRLDANEAIHEGDNGTALSEDPVQYVEFLELLLHMGFELVTEIEERQGQRPSS